MRIEFEEYYGSTPFICRNCFLDCSECPYDADIFTLARVDELLLKKRLREQEIRRAEKALAEIERQLDMLRTP
ncbi:MAG: hypothetical protein IKF48_03020 [Oscillospiraceae bacterium]|nr:hypothetical protein [Oscillospiraceae bacterium]